jgi:hypothetical protein
VTFAGRCCDAVRRVWGSTNDRAEGVSVAVRITPPAAPVPTGTAWPHVGARGRAADKAADDQPTGRRAVGSVDADECE